jgi:hypothetical protein
MFAARQNFLLDRDGDPTPSSNVEYTQNTYAGSVVAISGSGYLALSGSDSNVTSYRYNYNGTSWTDTATGQQQIIACAANQNGDTYAIGGTHFSGGRVLANKGNQITNPIAYTGALFGQAIAFDASGNKMVVLGFNASGPVNAYIYNYNGTDWVLSDTIVDAGLWGTITGSTARNSVAMSYDGQYIATNLLFDRCRVWRNISGTWTNIFTSSNGRMGSVAISGDGKILVAGGWVFSINGSTITTLQTGGAGGATNYFRVDVNYDGSRILLGDPANEIVYLNTRRSNTSWSTSLTIKPSWATATSDFGCSVGIDDYGDTCIIGSSFFSEFPTVNGRVVIQNI